MLAARLFFVLATVVLSDQTAGTCSRTDQMCEFWLVIEESITMMTGKALLVPHEGKLYHYEDTQFDTPINGPVIQADGYYQQPRTVQVVNRTLPGPAIEVYEGQRVVIHVENKLYSEATSIHWHGIHQKGTSFMDGVPFVTQCPILPGQTFSYDFLVEQTGTYWYHSHQGAQRTNGIFGPFIIHPRTMSHTSFTREHILSISDWNHNHDSTTGHLKMIYGIFNGKVKYKSTHSVDGSLFSIFEYHAGLINGKGRFWFNSTHHNQAPLTVFNVTQGETVRFRVISTGTIYPFRISVDNHSLTMLASDGYEFDPVVVESFIIHPGERYDFLLSANQAVDNYWLRAITLEESQRHIAEAVIHYDGAEINTGSDDKISSKPLSCSVEQKCGVLNCPFERFLDTEPYTCIHLTALNATDSSPPVQDIIEQFYNFAFPGIEFTPGAINGIQWKNPTVSAYSQKAEIDSVCNSCGVDEVCLCSHTQILDYNKSYQMVFANVGRGHQWGHPVHLHGHSFYIIKQGFALTDPVSGKNGNQSEDLQCLGNKTLNYCNTILWANGSWSGGTVPGLALTKPIRKDTVMVPSGGYVVIRFRADNPGMWMMHCHIEIHHLDGMVMMFDEAAEKQIKVPKRFPTCRNYLTSTGDVISGPDVQDDGKKCNAVVSMTSVSGIALLCHLALHHLSSS